MVNSQSFCLCKATNNVSGGKNVTISRNNESRMSHKSANQSNKIISDSLSAQNNNPIGIGRLRVNSDLVQEDESLKPL